MFKKCIVSLFIMFFTSSVFAKLPVEKDVRQYESSKSCRSCTLILLDTSKLSIFDRFENSDLTGALLSKSYLKGNFSGSFFNDTIMERINAHSMTCQNCKFVNAKMKASRITNSDLSNSDFSSVDLSKTQFFTNNCENCDFTGTNLSGSDFRGSILFNAKLSPEQIKQGYFCDAIMPDGTVGICNEH